MIRFITGKPGGGKGIVTCQQVIDELRNGDRPIIAYFAFRFDPWVRTWKQRGKLHVKPEIGMAAYLQREYGSDFDLRRRVHLLDDDNAAEFFLYRVLDGKLVKSECDRDDKGSVVAFDHDLGKKAGGCLYIVDEAWKFYSSRNWGKTAAGFSGYVPLNRHFGDDVLVVTQHTKQIDVACQRVAQDFWVSTNHSKLKIGIFRQPDVFSVAVYDQAPTGSSLTPMERKVFRLDKAGLGACYDTAGGLKGVTAGSVGSAGDMFARKSGLPWWCIILFIIVVGYTVLKLMHLSGWLVGHQLSKHSPASNPHPAFVSGFSSAGVPASSSSFLPESVIHNFSPDFHTNRPVTCVGVVVCSGFAQVFLSDGRDARSDWGEVQKISPRSVICFNQTFPMAKTPDVVSRPSFSLPRDLSPVAYSSSYHPDSETFASQQKSQSGVITIPNRSPLDMIPRSISGFRSQSMVQQRMQQSPPSIGSSQVDNSLQ